MIPFALPLALLPLYILLRRIYYAYIYPSALVSPPTNGVPRPPLVVDWIPFVGSALDMTKGDPFWRRIVRGYGPAFRLRTMGEVRTYVTTPGLISYVYKNSRNFLSSSAWYVSHFLIDIDKREKKLMEQNNNHAQSDVMDAEVFPQHHKAMQPGSIAALIRRYADLLEERIQRETRDIRDEGKVVDLADYAFDILFEASSKAFFSPSFPHKEFKDPFMAFDAAFPLLNLAALPQLARRPAEKSRDEALRIVERWWETCSEEDKKAIAPSMAGMVDCAEKEGWPERDVASLFLSEIWALEANAPYAGIWATVELLRNPSILTRLRAELEGVISTLSPPTLSTLLHTPQPDLPTLLPLTNAIFQETLRYHVDTLSLRVVQTDCVIPAHLLPTGVGHGRGLQLKAGEQVICVTRVPTTDGGDWGGDAGTWRPDRFLEEGKRGSMNPFGGGVSMCEGRHFASAEILTFIAAFAYNFDAEIITDNLHPNLQRPGLGVQQTLGNFKVRLREREVE